MFYIDRTQRILADSKQNKDYVTRLRGKNLVSQWMCIIYANEISKYPRQSSGSGKI